MPPGVFLRLKMDDESTISEDSEAMFQLSFRDETYDAKASTSTQHAFVLCMNANNFQINQKCNIPQNRY